MRILLGLLLLSGLAWAQTTPDSYPTKIMYFSPKPEMKLSEALRRLDLPLAVVRIGIADGEQGKQLGLVRFLAPGGSKAQCRREAVRIARVAFGLLPQLQQLDLTGDDRDDQAHQKTRPEVLFSSSLKRGELAGIPVSATPGRQLEGAGRVRYSTKLQDDPETVGTVAATLRDIFQEGLRRMPIRRHQRSSPPSH